ncbi:iron-sulfur cluster assembly accessory protein [Anaplasmataceae bacterium AB001_6]|nr:iron-sulfur cluster assembly accessory protein [Anaplasmataceae bacterium AB001_6]
MARSVITVTTLASDKLFESILNKEEQGAFAIKIVVVNGGCYGKKYNMEFIYDKDTIHKLDEIVRIHSTKYKNLKDKFYVVVDRRSILSVIGTELDYKSDDISQGFVFNNPQESGRCGCGESFS